MSDVPLLPRDVGAESQQYLVVRFNDVGVRDLELNISNVDVHNVDTRWLRRMCRSSRADATVGRRMRFIRGGAILRLNSDLAGQITRFFDSNSSGQGEEGSIANEKFYVHCIVGTEQLSAEELAHEDEFDDIGPSSDSVTTPAIGFDRLRSVGFSDEEIEVIREQFRSTYGDLQVESSASNRTENETDIRHLEEQWMETGVNTSNSEANPNADVLNSVPIANYHTNVEFLLALTLGYFTGVFGFLLIKIDGLFGRKQKFGIFAGIIMNICLSLGRYII